MAGKQVKLFPVEGTPGGLTTAEITNWTGHIVTGPRSRLAELLDRDEAKRTGVYLLLGDDPEAPAGVRCYIGEADEVRTRLKEHHSVRGKEFWDRLVVITSKDANLTKSHCRYLEAKLIALADAAGRSLLDNSTKPPTPMLPALPQPGSAPLQVVGLGRNHLRPPPISTVRPVLERSSKNWSTMPVPAPRFWV